MAYYVAKARLSPSLPLLPGKPELQEGCPLLREQRLPCGFLRAGDLGKPPRELPLGSGGGRTTCWAWKQALGGSGCHPELSSVILRLRGGNAGRTPYADSPPGS